MDKCVAIPGFLTLFQSFHAGQEFRKYGGFWLAGKAGAAEARLRGQAWGRGAQQPPPGQIAARPPPPPVLRSRKQAYCVFVVRSFPSTAHPLRVQGARRRGNENKSASIFGNLSQTGRGCCCFCPRETQKPSSLARSKEGEFPCPRQGALSATWPLQGDLAFSPPCRGPISGKR